MHRICEYEHFSYTHSLLKFCVHNLQPFEATASVNTSNISVAKITFSSNVCKNCMSRIWIRFMFMNRLKCLYSNMRCTLYYENRFDMTWEKVQFPYLESNDFNVKNSVHPSGKKKKKKKKKKKNTWCSHLGSLKIKIIPCVYTKSR